MGQVVLSQLEFLSHFFFVQHSVLAFLHLDFLPLPASAEKPDNRAIVKSPKNTFFILNDFVFN